MPFPQKIKETKYKNQIWSSWKRGIKGLGTSTGLGMRQLPKCCLYAMGGPQVGPEIFSSKESRLSSFSAYSVRGIENRSVTLQRCYSGPKDQTEMSLGVFMKNLHRSLSEYPYSTYVMNCTVLFFSHKIRLRAGPCLFCSCVYPPHQVYFCLVDEWIL